MRHLVGIFVAAVAALIQIAPAHADPAPGTLSVDAATSVVTYHLVHKLHKFDGVSKRVEGKARLLPDGQAQVMIRIPVESFDSQNVNRDAHMKEVVESARFPNIEVKAVGVAGAPASFPATVDKTFKAEVPFHGVKNTLDVPVKITFESATKIRAEAHFSLSLDAFKIERPSLMFVKVDDELKIDVAVGLTK